MQNTVRWRSDRLDGAVVGCFQGIPGKRKVIQMWRTLTAQYECCYSSQCSPISKLNSIILFEIRFVLLHLSKIVSGMKSGRYYLLSLRAQLYC